MIRKDHKVIWKQKGRSSILNLSSVAHRLSREDRVPTLNVYISLRWFCIECTLRLFLISIVTTPFCGNGLGLSGYWRKFDVLVDVFRH